MTVTATLRRILYRLGLLEAAWVLRERLAPPHLPGAMKFPSFDRTIQRAAVGTGDYARYASLALAIRRVETEGIQDPFAEIGVCQGATSRFILRCAPGRRLYLFDTFEGFPLGDREMTNRGDRRFRDTSDENVRRVLGKPTNGDPHDPDRWARETLRLASDEEQRECLKRAGRARAAELTYRNTAVATLAVLREAAGVPVRS